uniref:C2 domain-containing protein n=1 Tax=Macrostomum lignano TaxID=282301 RepID=A0A1I8F1R3_9PLAT
DLPCTGVFAVISLLGSSFVTERSRSVRSELPVVAPIDQLPRLLDPRPHQAEHCRSDRWPARRLHSEPPPHASFKCSRLQAGPVAEGGWAGEAEQMMRQPCGFLSRGERCTEAPLAAAQSGPLEFLRIRVRTPGGPANFTHGCRLPASLWDRGSPAAFVFGLLQHLRRFRGPLSCCASPRTRRRPNPFQSVATETVSDTVSPMFGVCLISGYRFEERQTIQVEVFAEVESASPEAASSSSPPEFEADLNLRFQPPQELSWPTATRRHLLEFMNSSSPRHFSQRQLIGSCSVSLGHVIHCGGRVTCQLGCSSADGEATCSSKLGWDFPHSSLLFPFRIWRQPRASISVKVEEYEGNKETLQLALRGRGLDKKDLFGKSDPYVLLQRRSDKGSEFIGEFSTTVDDLLAGQNSELQFDISVKTSPLEYQPSFLDYLFS